MFNNINRDVKPDNIMLVSLNDNSRIKLIDF